VDERPLVEKLDSIEHWRNKVFGGLLNYVLVFGAITAVPSIAAAIVERLWMVVAVDAFALGWIVGIRHFKWLSYPVRVLNFLALIFVVGTALMMSIGPIGQIYLFAAPVMATYLLGLRPALYTLVIASLEVFVLSWLGFTAMQVNALSDSPVLAALVITLNFVFVGSIITVSSSMLLRGLSGSLGRLGIFASSLEKRRNELQALNGELRLTSAALARLNDMVVVARAGNGTGPQPIIFVNEAFEKRTGFPREQLIGRDCALLLGAQRDSDGAQHIAHAMANMQAASAELVYETSSGDRYWVEMEVVPFADEDGANTHLVAVARDITERKRAERDIHQLAFYDVLTGLPNRRLLVQRIDALLAAAHNGSQLGALLFIDLDRFKTINDARGHSTGDAMLRHVAQQLSALRGSSDTVARIGGDEFVMLLAELGDDTDEATARALAMADNVRMAIAASFEIEGQLYASSASIGVSLLSAGSQSAHDLLREADTAMYRAKLTGRNRVAMFEATMRAEVEQRLSLERDLAAALENDELAMHVQLQVDRAGNPRGAELLARWRRADGSYVPPDRFIPVAEECGLILPLGQWALRQACAMSKTLEQAGFPLPLSVNVSPSQFRQPDFVAQVRAILADTGASAQHLIFEVTEGLLIENLEYTLARMHELAALGIRLSIDDFGTGYSSMAYLRRMPLYELKIDRSFIADTPGDANGTAIVQSILAMAGHLGLRSIAEGVETSEQASFLAANGVSAMQGFLFARPVPMPELIALLKSRSDDEATAAAAQPVIAAAA
jgi:diguanylate cyclase (GGDEF)-like protein/PAS domain S-box-containing protein